MIRPRPGVLALLLALCAIPAAAGPLRITGKILHPPKDAQVELRPWAVEHAEALRWLKGETVPPIASAKPRADGSFALEAPDTGFYSVVVRAEGHLALEGFLTFLVEDMELPPVELSPASPLEVKAVGADGQPLAGVTIQALPLKPESGDWRAAGRSAVTDAEGKAVFLRAEGEALALVVTTPGRYATASTNPTGASQTIRFPAQRTRTVEFRGADGKPAVGALVRLARRGWPYGLTGEDGRIPLPVPLKDEIGLFAEDSRGLRIEVVMTVEAGEGTDVPVLTLRSPTSASGKVLEAASREPIAGALVWNGGTVWVRTGSGGTFELRAPSGDRGRIEAAAAGFTRSLFRWQRDANAPITLLLGPAAALSGQVVDEAGKPVEGAEIETLTNPAEHLRARMERKTSVSGPDGRFLIRQVPAGRIHTVLAAKEGFAPARRLADSTAPVRLVLRGGTVAAGRVVDGQGLPVAGAELTLTAAGEDPTPGPAQAFSAVSDARGSFQLPHVSPGRFELQAARPGFAAAFVSGILIPESEPQADLGEITLLPGAAIEGIVVDERDRPVQGAHVVLTPFGAEGFPGEERVVMSREPVDTGADGRFRLADLPRGARIGIQVVHDELASADMPGVEIPTAQPLRIRLVRPRSVEGRVTDALGEPIPGARLYLGEGTGAPLGGGWERRPGHATTDPEGRFVLSGAKPGTAYVTVIASGYKTRQSQLQVPEEGQAPPVEIALEPGTYLEGFVQDGRGAPMSRASVFVQGRDPMSVRMAVPTDDEGHYEISDLEPGPLEIQATLRGGPSASVAFEVRPGRNRLDLKLPDGTEVSGRVVDSLGSPVPGASLFLRAAPGESEAPMIFQPDSQAVSSADGSFVLQGVPDGEYRLLGTRQGFAPATIPEVRVDGAPVAGLELRLGPGTVIRGRLLGLDPLAGSRIKVWAFSPDAGASLEGVVDPSGSYRIQDAAPGTWDLMAHFGSSGVVTARVEVSPGEVEVVQDLEFPSGFTLTGRVLLGRSPLPGAQVQVFGTNPESPGGGQGETAHDGTFRLERLPAGTYTLTVMLPTGPVHSETIEIRGDEEITVALPAGAENREP
ncbi:MAG: carboxypeptidase regulatory-like domain-containing protein [Thermoanaerobaculia bacterium]